MLKKKEDKTTMNVRGGDRKWFVKDYLEKARDLFVTVDLETVSTHGKSNSSQPQTVRRA